MSSLDTAKDWSTIWGLNDDPSPSGSSVIPAFFNVEGIQDTDSEGLYDNDEEIKKWLETAIPILQERLTQFTRKSVENSMFYKGVQMLPDRQYYSFDDANRYHRTDKVSFNIIYEFVELWVNRMASYPPDIAVTPNTDDPEARDSAESKELALKDFFHKNKIKELLTKFDRHCFTLGEAYMHAYFDQDAGPLHPEYEEIKDRYKSFKRVTTESGEDVNIDREPRIGDVRVEIVPAIYVLFEEREWEDLDYIILDRPTNIDKLRSDYPDVELKGDGDVSCYWMYHLPTKYLPKGRFVKFSCGEVLENTDFPYKRPMFPIIRMTNIDVIGASRAKSFIENIKPHQVLINSTITETWNNLRRSHKGKWLYPAKTVNPAHMHPQSPACEYYGNTPPKFQSYDGINREALDFIKLLREEAEKQARIQGIVQGTPPPNVRSGLQFAQLEEMEKKSVEITVTKKFSAIEQLGEVVSTIMARYYKPEDQRYITMYGKDKEYLTQPLKLDAIKEDSVVRVELDPLPTGTASQMAFYSDLRQQFGPNVVPDEMMIDMLDSGRFNQYTEFGGATVETTNVQIAQMRSGKKPAPPGAHEDLILKWKIIVGTMRKRAYLDYTEEAKSLFEQMVYAIEDLIINKQNQSMAMQEQLATLKSFPIFYKPESFSFEPPAPPMPPAPPAGPAEAMEPGVTDGLEEIPPEMMGEPI